MARLRRWRGAAVQAQSGLGPSDRLRVNPSDGLRVNPSDRLRASEPPARLGRRPLLKNGAQAGVPAPLAARHRIPDAYFRGESSW